MNIQFCKNDCICRIKYSHHSPKPSALLQRAHLQPSSLGAAVLYCVGEVRSTGSAGGSTSRRTAGGAEQRLTNSAGTTRGCVMLYLETRHLCSVLHSEPQWCTYQTAEKQKFTLSRREEKDSLFWWEDLMEWISRGNVGRELLRGCVWKRQGWMGGKEYKDFNLRRTHNPQNGHPPIHPNHGAAWKVTMVAWFDC